MVAAAVLVMFIQETRIMFTTKSRCSLDRDVSVLVLSVENRLNN
jgi:hypothetical protein